MKKLFFLYMLVFLMMPFVFAQQATNKKGTTSPSQQETTPAIQEETAPVLTPVTDEIVTLNGDIIDDLCANANKTDLANFIKTHTKECTLKPDCIASGYSIFTDGQLYKFDNVSNVKIEDFLKKEDSKLQVMVTAKKVGDKLSLISIENEK